MHINQIRHMAAEKNIHPLPRKKIDIIHSIQKKEGNNPCYSTGVSKTCGQENCLWRNDCLKADKK